MIRMTMGHDDESQMTVRRREHIFNGFDNRANIACARRSFEHSAIDQDVLIPLLCRNDDEEEVAKSNAVHSNSETRAALRRFFCLARFLCGFSLFTGSHFSEPRMQHVEIQFEPFFIIALEKPLLQVEVPLPSLSLFAVGTRKSLSNEIAKVPRSISAIFHRRLRNQQG